MDANLINDSENKYCQKLKRNIHRNLNIHINITIGFLWIEILTTNLVKKSTPWGQGGSPKFLLTPNLIFFVS